MLERETRYLWDTLSEFRSAINDNDEDLARLAIEEVVGIALHFEDCRVRDRARAALANAARTCPSAKARNAARWALDAMLPDQATGSR